MIEPTDLVGVDSNTALRVIAYALSIAPCLDTLEGRNRDSVIAILTGVGKEVVGRGSRLVKSQRIGPASVDYTAVGSCFSDDDRAVLRSVCGGATPGGPIGQFPVSRVVTGVWPED